MAFKIKNFSNALKDPDGPSKVSSKEANVNDSEKNVDKFSEKLFPNVLESNGDKEKRSEVGPGDMKSKVRFKKSDPLEDIEVFQNALFCSIAVSHQDPYEYLQQLKPFSSKTFHTVNEIIELQNYGGTRSKLNCLLAISENEKSHEKMVIIAFKDPGWEKMSEEIYSQYPDFGESIAQDIHTIAEFYNASKIITCGHLIGGTVSSTLYLNLLKEQEKIIPNKIDILNQTFVESDLKMMDGMDLFSKQTIKLHRITFEDHFLKLPMFQSLFNLSCQEQAQSGTSSLYSYLSTFFLFPTILMGKLSATFKEKKLKHTEEEWTGMIAAAALVLETPCLNVMTKEDVDRCFSFHTNSLSVVAKESDIITTKHKLLTLAKAKDLLFLLLAEPKYFTDEVQMKANEKYIAMTYSLTIESFAMSIQLYQKRMNQEGMDVEILSKEDAQSKPPGVKTRETSHETSLELQGKMVLDWKKIIQDNLPSLEKSNKTIWAISELYDIEQLFEKRIESFDAVERGYSISIKYPKNTSLKTGTPESIIRDPKKEMGDSSSTRDLKIKSQISDLISPLEIEEIEIEIETLESVIESFDAIQELKLKKLSKRVNQLLGKSLESVMYEKRIESFDEKSQELEKLTKLSERSTQLLDAVEQERGDSSSAIDLTSHMFADSDLKSLPSNIVDLISVSIKNKNRDVGKTIKGKTLIIMQKFWKLVLRIMLPDYPALVDAIETLYPGDEGNSSSLAAIQQIIRFSKMGILNMDQFMYVIDQVEKDLPEPEIICSIGKNKPNKQNNSEPYFNVYDVILQHDMPNTEEEKKTLMVTIGNYFENIKSDAAVQQFLLAKHNILEREPLGSEVKFDWNDIEVDVINIFFGFKTHCLIKISVNNPNEKYDVRAIPIINALIKIAVESMDTFVRKEIKIEEPSTWRGQNSKKLSVRLTWDKSWFRSLFRKQPLEEELKNVAIELIRKIPYEMKDEDHKKKLKEKLSYQYGLLPADVDALIKQFETIPLTERDATKIDIEFSCGILNPSKKIVSNIPLWPYWERELNDIDDARVRTGFSLQCIQQGLPVSIANEFITRLDIFVNDEALYDQAFIEASADKVGEPFHRIFNFYKENGGTFRGWIHALETCRDHPGKPTKDAFMNNEASRIEVLNKIVSGTMEEYNAWYTQWEEKYKALPKLITNYDSFRKQFESHGIGNFQRMGREDLKSNLKVADQIWLFREQFGGYAHVLLYLGRYEANHYVVHVSAIGSNLLAQTIRFVSGIINHKGTAMIKKDKLNDVIKEEDRSFIVRIESNKEQQENIIKRALACVNPDKPPIEFVYNGFSGNCESAVNAFYGIWDDEVTSLQGQMASGELSVIARALVLATKRGSDEDLRNKLMARIQEEAPGGAPPPQQAVLVQGQEPLTASMLAAAPPQEQNSPTWLLFFFFSSFFFGYVISFFYKQ